MNCQTVKEPEYLLLILVQKKPKKKPYHQSASSTINVHAFCRVNFDSKEQAKLRKHNRPV